MSSRYQFRLCDDRGVQMHLFEKVDNFSYSRSTQGLGTLQLSVPFDKYVKEIPSVFKPDWRVDVWRSPQEGIPARREGSFLMGRHQVYQRASDNMRVIEFYARSPIDILRRQCWETNVDQTNELDDIMKNLVRTKFTGTASANSTAPYTVNGSTYTYTGEFAVDEDAADGPSITAGKQSLFLRNILDILNDLRKSSVSLNLASSSNKKIYFDVIEDDSLAIVSGGFGYRFRTYPELRGQDRTTGIIFSPENGNLISPVYFEDYQDEITAVSLYNQGVPLAAVQSDNQYLSRWHFIKQDKTTSQDTAAGAQSEAYADLKKGAVKKTMKASFLSSPGSPEQPRSLYGLDWDLGDLLPVNFAGKSMNAEVAIVYVSVNDQGEEKITGRSQIGE